MNASSLSLILALLLAFPVLAASDIDYLRAGKFVEARAVIEQALQHDPGSAELHCNLGIALLRLRDYTGALEHLRKATSLQPHLTPAWLNLAACYVCIGEFDRAIEAYQYASNLAPTSGAAIDQLTSFLNAARKVDETTPDYYQPNWQHWRHDATIKLWVSDPVGTKGYRKAFRNIAIQAMRELIAATNGKLKFQVVDRRDDANVTCDWSPPNAQGMMLERGITSGAAEGGKIVLGVTQISLNNESGMEFLSDEMVRKSCLHEFMHVLGVSGHSTNVEDTMFALIELPTVEPRLSLRDKATLKRLYSAP
jgi:tetratricopeptide (TPR) repeat protein